MTSERPLLRALASVAVTVGLLVWVGSRVDRSAVWGALEGGRWGWWLAAAALGPVQVGRAAARWRVACARLGLLLGGGVAVREVALSTLLNQLLPGGVAGDVVRAWRVRQPGHALAGPVRAVLVDRFVGLAVHVAVVALGLLAWRAVHGVSAPAGAVPTAVAVAAGLLAILAAPAGWPGLGSLAADLRRALGAPGPAVAQVSLSVALTASFLLAFEACARALGHPLGVAALTAVPLVLLAMAIPASIGGWGWREATAALVLPRLGWSPEQAVALSAVYGLSVLVGALPGALVPLWRDR